MSKFVIVSLVASSVLLATQAMAGISNSSAKEVEMEMTADKEIVIKRAQGDAALFVLSAQSGQPYTSPALKEAMALVQKEAQAKGQNPSALELAIEIINRQ